MATKAKRKPYDFGKSSGKPSNGVVKFTVDPELFTDEQWTEMFYCTTTLRMGTDRRRGAGKIEATKKTIEEAIRKCRSKAEYVLDNEEDGDDGVNVAQWHADLLGAVEVLEKLIGVESPQRPKMKALGRRELATIIAALRVWQHRTEGRPFAEADMAGKPMYLDGIATDHGEVEALNAAEIDHLIDTLN